MKITEELLNRYLNIEPVTIGHFATNGYMNPEISPIQSDFRVAGPALTVRIPYNDSSALYAAMYNAKKGDILVIDRVGNKSHACVGGGVAEYCQKLGIAAIIIDGPATDIQELKEIKIPIFCTGLSVVTTTIQGYSGEYGTTVQCGGATVNPGDLIFADDNGVLVIPPDKMLPYLETAEAREAQQKETKELKDFHERFKHINALYEFNMKDVTSKILKGE